MCCLEYAPEQKDQHQHRVTATGRVWLRTKDAASGDSKADSKSSGSGGAAAAAAGGDAAGRRSKQSSPTVSPKTKAAASAAASAAVEPLDISKTAAGANAGAGASASPAKPADPKPADKPADGKAGAAGLGAIPRPQTEEEDSDLSESLHPTAYDGLMLMVLLFCLFCVLYSCSRSRSEFERTEITDSERHPITHSARQHARSRYALSCRQTGRISEW